MGDVEIDISSLKRGLKEMVEFSFQGEVQSFHPDVVTSEVIVQGRVTRSSDGLYGVSGQLSAPATAVCGRCLQPYSIDLSQEFAECFKQADAVETANAAECFLVQGDRIDLQDMVQHLLCFAIPSKLLCGEACAGICPICGQDRNQQACSCEQLQIDPRLLALKDLLDPKE